MPMKPIKIHHATNPTPARSNFGQIRLNSTKGGRDKSGGYEVREAQKSSKRPDRMQQRRAMMALAPRTDQCIPDCLRRSPITVRQPASITPEPTKNFFSRNSA